jgi:proline racemase
MLERREAVRVSADHLRRAVVREPRGHEAMVGALLTPPVHDGSVAGIIFFNSRTYLGMCGHGLMGVVRTLERLGTIGEGCWRFDTPAGTVRAELGSTGDVTIQNVAARCHALDVAVHAPELGHVRGDVAYGGNWFFLTEAVRAPLTLGAAAALTREAQAVQDAVNAQGVTGSGGEPIDHIELSGRAVRADADARNFVLCSSGDYDRSPCGTGTSAVMAVRHARGTLAIGERWRQESITGGLFTGWLEESPSGELVPHIRGRAFVTGEAVLRFHPDDPFREGFAP